MNLGFNCAKVLIDDFSLQTEYYPFKDINILQNLQSLLNYQEVV
ncbi:hypothetical protein APA_481 [Pseudanabaena sp. lw0831]|nr:hypothetical protein APA_481 [Pseudanabaena sp. lw0831]